MAKDKFDGFMVALRQALEDAETDPELLAVDPLDPESDSQTMAPEEPPVRRFNGSAGKDIRTLRGRLGLSQQRFADAFGVSVGTVRNWEQGRRRPDGPAQILLQVIDREPNAVLRALSDAEPGT